MKIVVINTGSSSIKYELFDMDKKEMMASGMAEKIGEKSSVLTHKRVLLDGELVKIVEKKQLLDHEQGLRRIVALLVDPENGAVKEKSEISAVGHRVVHGGENMQTSRIIDKDVIAAIKENIPLAPLHNPANLTGIEVALSVFPAAPQIAVFDTAFHQTLPMKSFLYAIPYELYEKEKIRKYGFHGTSHLYVAEKAARHLTRPLDELNLITVHLGNGGSMAAVENGKCVETTMGMTPLAGLVMGTRCGDIDPAIIFFLANTLKMSIKEIDILFNKESGLKGICKSNDMREIVEKMEAGDELATMAVEMYTHRIKKYIGAYYAVLGTVDAIIFTAGIGENSPLIRELCCRNLEKFGIKIDLNENNNKIEGVTRISAQEGEVSVLVIPTNEELKIAQETEKVLNSK
ncbi:MAG: acetate kinase [Thermodesulfobacteriota bacterium]|nr:acetate kinase [Thermodesulfobacteriota bacterium]